MGNCASDASEPEEPQRAPAPPPARIITNDNTLTDVTLWKNGNSVNVHAYGPGKLHLLSVPSNNDTCWKYISSARTDFEYTEFLISFSYSYERFVFYWEGDREDIKAQYGTRESLDKLTLGTSWREATEVDREGVFRKVCLMDHYFDDTREQEDTAIYITYPDPVGPSAGRTTSGAARDVDKSPSTTRSCCGHHGPPQTMASASSCTTATGCLASHSIPVVHHYTSAPVQYVVPASA